MCVCRCTQLECKNVERNLRLKSRKWLSAQSGQISPQKGNSRNILCQFQAFLSTIVYGQIPDTYRMFVRQQRLSVWCLKIVQISTLLTVRTIYFCTLFIYKYICLLACFLSTSLLVSCLFFYVYIGFWSSCLFVYVYISFLSSCQ